jgi:hypothetical protein
VALHVGGDQLTSPSGDDAPAGRRLARFDVGVCHR